MNVTETVDATKTKMGRTEALALARSAGRVLVARGKKVVIFDMEKSPPDDESLAAQLLGPTGNLKAPTVRRGRDLLVGFNEEAYGEVLGG